MPSQAPQGSPVVQAQVESEKRDTDSELVTHILRKKEEAKRAMDSLFRLTKENIGMLEGIQYVSINRLGVPVNTIGNAMPATTRLIDNRTLDMARRLHARLDQPTYRPEVTALTEVPEDHEAARVAQDILRQVYYKTQFSRRKRLALWWEVAAGFFYLEPYFDSLAGPKIPTPRIAGTNPLTTEPIVEISSEPAGEVDFVIRSPMAVYRDPRFTEWNQMQWVFIEEVAAREDVLARFSDDWSAAHPDKPSLTDELPEESIDPVSYVPELSSYASDIAGVVTKAAGGVRGAVRLGRYYERPSQKYPNGRQAILAGKKLLYRGDMGTSEADLPPVPFGYIMRPWSHEGKSPVGEVRGLQKVLNLVLSRWVEHVRRWAAGWLLIPTTSGIPVKGWASTVSSIIRFNPAGGKPEFVQPPFGNLRAYLDLVAKMETSMEERMSLPPAMRGQMPRGAKAAKMVELLQEAADAIQAPVIADLADGFSLFWTKVLGLVIHHYSDDYLLRLLGEHKRAAVRHLKSEAMRLDWKSRLLVRAEAAQPLPASRIARNQLILDLSRRDLLFGPVGSDEHNRKLRDALGLEASVVPSESDKDADIANNENRMLRMGRSVQVSPIDSDQVHINIHSDAAKAMRGIDQDADIRLFLQHIGQHRQQLQVKIQSTVAPPQPPPAGQLHPGPAGSEPQPVHPVR